MWEYSRAIHPVQPGRPASHRPRALLPPRPACPAEDGGAVAEAPRADPRAHRRPGWGFAQFRSALPDGVPGGRPGGGPPLPPRRADLRLGGTPRLARRLLPRAAAAVG